MPAMSTAYRMLADTSERFLGGLTDALGSQLCKTLQNGCFLVFLLSQTYSENPFLLRKTLIIRGITGEPESSASTNSATPAKRSEHNNSK